VISALLILAPLRTRVSNPTSDLKRCHRRSSFGFRPKVLNSTEDAHAKSMSTFGTDEHFQALMSSPYTAGLRSTEGAASQCY
jgi:hypothetical protein